MNGRMETLNFTGLSKEVYVMDIVVLTGGLSIGVASVNDEDEFKSAIKEVQKFEDTLLIEEKITGK